MMRFIFLLLLVINLGFAAFIYLEINKPNVPQPEEINREQMKILSIADPVKASREAQTAKKLAQSLIGAQCVSFNVKPADAARIQALLAPLNLGERLMVSNAEEATRFAVMTAPQRDKRAAESVIASLKKQGVNDVSLMPDNSISLGVFSTEEAARHLLADVQTKGVRTAQIMPRNVQSRETQFIVREPEVDLIAQLTILQQALEGSSLKAAAACPAASPGR